MTLPQDDRAPHRQQRWIEIENVGASTIPAFGMLEIVESYRPESTGLVLLGGPTVVKVKRPTQDNLTHFLINGPQSLAVGARGSPATNDFPTLVAYDDGFVPATGDEWGTAANSYLATKNKRGLYVIGDVGQGLMRVMRWSDFTGPLYVGDLAEAMCTTDSAADCDNITNVDTGASLGNITALNSFVLAGENDDLVLIKWIKRFNDYVIIQVEHKLVSVLIEGSVYIDGLNLKGKVRDISTMYCGPIRTITLVGLNECP